MNPNFSPTPELRRLISGMCEGSLSDSEITELELTLKQDKDALTYYVHYLGLHTSLAWSISAQHADDAEQSPQTHKSPWPLAATLAALRRPTPLSISIAALVLLAIITTSAFITLPVYRQLTRSTLSEKTPRTEAVAIVKNFDDVVWLHNERHFSRGERLAPGQVVAVHAGLVEIQFFGGTNVILEGPATFVAHEPGQGELTHGKLAARIDNPAAAFRLKTPAFQVVDLGTEFGVACDAAGKGIVQVFEGEVEVSLKDAPNIARKLSVGEVLSIADNRLEATNASTTPFVRQADFAEITSPDVIADARRDFRRASPGNTSSIWQHQGIPGKTTGVWNYYVCRSLRVTEPDASRDLLEFRSAGDRGRMAYCDPNAYLQMPAVSDGQIFFSEHDGSPKSFELVVHPGNEPSFAVVRWTANEDSPRRVRVHGVARMLGIADEGADGVTVEILAGSKAKAAFQLPPADHLGRAFSFETDIEPGENIDFIIGPNQGFSNDQVGLKALISKVKTAERRER